MDDFTKNRFGNCMTKNNSAAIYKIDDEIMSFIASNMLSVFASVWNDFNLCL